MVWGSRELEGSQGSCHITHCQRALQSTGFPLGLSPIQAPLSSPEPLQGPRNWCPCSLQAVLLVAACVGLLEGRSRHPILRVTASLLYSLFLKEDRALSPRHHGVLEPLFKALIRIVVLGLLVWIMVLL